EKSPSNKDEIQSRKSPSSRLSGQISILQYYLIFLPLSRPLSCGEGTGALQESNIYAKGVTITMVNIVRSTQMMTKSRTVIGISVDMITGMVAEKKIIAETDTTAMTNFVIRGTPIPEINNDGKNISAISIDTALAASKGSGTCTIHVNG